MDQVVVNEPEDVVCGRIQSLKFVHRRVSEMGKVFFGDACIPNTERQFVRRGFGKYDVSSKEIC